MTIKELIACLSQYPEDTEVLYTYDNITASITRVDYEDKLDWLPFDIPSNERKLMETGNKIIILE